MHTGVHFQDEPELLKWQISVVDFIGFIQSSSEQTFGIMKKNKKKTGFNIYVTESVKMLVSIESLYVCLFVWPLCELG